MTVCAAAASFFGCLRLKYVGCERKYDRGAVRCRLFDGVSPRSIPPWWLIVFHSQHFIPHIFGRRQCRCKWASSSSKESLLACSFVGMECFVKFCCPIKDHRRTVRSTWPLSDYIHPIPQWPARSRGRRDFTFGSILFAVYMLYTISSKKNRECGLTSHCGM